MQKSISTVVLGWTPRFWLAAAAIICAFFLQIPSHGQASESEYRFGPDDTLRLRIYEWRPSLDAIFAWEALNNDYTVGAAGDLSLPLVGRVQAAGRTRDELASHIGELLFTRMGLGRQPAVAIEIVQYRPFYVIGQVTNSGAFPHRPDLTVLQAVSMAGGLRTRAEERLEVERDSISRTGELEVLRLQRDHLMARLARLEAEVAQTDSVQFPNELAERRNEPAVSELLKAEQLIFAAREDAYDTQMRTLEQLKRNLETEIPSLTAQLRTVDTQIRLIEEELQTVTTLLQAGLANAPRRMDLERQIARTEGERLRVESGLLRAKQEISKAEISIVELRTGRTRDVRVELREAQSKLEELGRRIETTRQLVDAAAAASPYVIDSDGSGRTAEPVYYLVRRVNDQTTELPVDETTPVQPGDTVKVYIRIGRNQERSESKASNLLSSR